jgi:hypothetical protein
MAIRKNLSVYWHVIFMMALITGPLGLPSWAAVPSSKHAVGLTKVAEDPINPDKTASTSEWLGIPPPAIPLLTGLLVFITAIIGQIILIRQFGLRTKHEIDLKRHEAHSSFQRDIYIEAAETIAKATSFVMRLPQMNYAEVAVENQKIELGNVTNKVAMIGSHETILALSGFSEQFAKILLDNFAALLDENKDVTAETNLGTTIEHNLTFQKNITSQLVAMTPQERASLDGSVLFGQGQKIYQEITQMISQRSAIQKRLAKSRLRRIKEVMKACGPLLNELTNANIAVRKELSFPIDAEAYRAHAQESFRRAELLLGEFIDKIENELKS